MSLKKLMKPVFKAGYVEKDAVLPNGTTLHYAESPANQKEPFLLIHGQTGSWMDYATVLPQLSKEYHVFAIDCHGHGKSSHNADRYSVKAMCEDFAWFVSNVIGQKVVLSGHSSGGLLSLYFSAYYSDLVSAVVLEDPPIYSTQAGERWEKSFAYVDTYETVHNFLHQTQEKDWVIYYLQHAMWGAFVGEKGMTKMIEYGKKYRAKHPDKPLNYFFLPDSVNHMFWFMDQYDLQFGETFYDQSWFEGFDRDDALQKISCPCVLIHTKWSVNEQGILMAAMSGDDAKRAASLIPNCKFSYIESGHDSHYEKPQEFLAAVAQIH